MYLRKPTSKEGSEVYLTLGIPKAATEETLPASFKDIQGSTTKKKNYTFLDHSQTISDLVAVDVP